MLPLQRIGWLNKAECLLAQMHQKQLSVIGVLMSNKQQTIQFVYEGRGLIEILAQLAELQKSNIEAIQKSQQNIHQKIKILKILRRDTLKQGTVELQDLQTTLQVKDFLKNYFFKSRLQADAFVKKHSLWIYEKKNVSIIRLLINKLQNKLFSPNKNTLSVNELKIFMDKVMNIVRSRVLRSVTSLPLGISHAQSMKFGIIVCSEIVDQQLPDLQSVDRAFRMRILEQAINFAYFLQLKIEKISIERLLKRYNILVRSILQWFPRIRKLRLAQCQLGNQSISILNQFIWLQSLDLNCNYLDNQALRQLSKAQYKNLKKLGLQSNPLSNKGLYYLAKAYWPKLIQLYLNNCNITKDGLHSIAKFANRLQLLALPEGDDTAARLIRERWCQERCKFIL